MLELKKNFEADWAERFESMVDFFSQGEFEKELLRAKNFFFSKLGRSHEMQESFYNAVSQSFLEWYLFDYRLAGRLKTPAVTFLSLQMGSEAQRSWVRENLFHHYSIFRVLSLEPNRVVVEDLLFSQKRFLIYDRSWNLYQSWKVQSQQLVQARLYPVPETDLSYASHVWLHLESEDKALTDLCKRLASQWGLHRDVLREALECLIRSYDLSDQLAAVRSQNWVFRDFYKNREKEKNAAAV